MCAPVPVSVFVLYAAALPHDHVAGLACVRSMCCADTQHLFTSCASQGQILANPVQETAGVLDSMHYADDCSEGKHAAQSTLCPVA